MCTYIHEMSAIVSCIVRVTTITRNGIFLRILHRNISYYSINYNIMCIIHEMLHNIHYIIYI